MSGKKTFGSAPVAACVLPNSPESEIYVLSSLMLDDTGEAWAIATQCGVRPKAFYCLGNEIIFETIGSLRSRGAPCDAGVVIGELRALGKLDDAGGVSHVLEVSGAYPTSAQVRYHAEQLVLLWQRRHTFTLASDLRDAAMAPGPREEFAEAVGGIGQRLIRFGHVTAPKSIAEHVAGVKADVLARAAGQADKSRWVCTGMPTIDRIPLGSGDEDHFIIVAGGSSYGKSALMRQWAGYAILDGKRVIFYTRETSIRGCIKKLAATWARVDLLNVERTLKDRLENFARKCDWLENEIADRRLFVVQHEPATPLMYVEELAQHYRAFSHLHGHPHLVVVDYAQLLLTKKRCSSREQEVATVSHTLQALCRESGNVWVVGAQYNDAGIREMRTVKKDDRGQIIHRVPVASDLRESQALYHDADRCYAIYRPPEDCRGTPQTDMPGLHPEQWLCMIKRREGGVGHVKCWFHMPFQLFAEQGREDVGNAIAGAAPAQTKAVPAGGMSKAAWKQQSQTKE